MMVRPSLTEPSEDINNAISFPIFGAVPVAAFLPSMLANWSILVNKLVNRDGWQGGAPPYQPLPTMKK